MPAENGWEVMSVLRRLLLSANADWESIGEQKAKCQGGRLRACTTVVLVVIASRALEAAIRL